MTHTILSRKNHAKSEDSLLLLGLDGSNPLGFLAAIGVWQVITNACTEIPVRLHWHPSHSTWVPRISADAKCVSSEEAFLTKIGKALVTRFEEHPAATLITQLESKLVGERRDVAFDQTQHANHCNRVGVDWLASFFCDANTRGETSQFQTVRRDYFAGNLKSIIDGTQEVHLNRCLFQPWDYADALNNQSLHWDPGEDRRHALQWRQPSGDPGRNDFGGMLGANRLAIEALPLFTSIPVNNSLQTTGFSGNRSNNTRWTWPIWKHMITILNIRSLLTLLPLQAERIDEATRKDLYERGIITAFRCRRILVGKTPNFTPAQRIA